MWIWRKIFRKRGDKIVKNRRYNKISEELFPKINKVMEEQKPYLDPKFSLETLGSLVGSNRTYVSYSLNRHKMDFNSFTRSYRCDYVIDILKNEPHKYDCDDVAILAGFSGSRQMISQLKKHHPDVYTFVKAFVKK